MPIWIGLEHETPDGAAAAVFAAEVAVAASTSATDAHAPPIATVIAFLTIE